MGLFSRRKHTSTDESGTPGSASATPSTGTPPDAEPGADAPRATAQGPWDQSDAPEAHRMDLGAVQVPVVPGMEVRMEVDKRSRAVTGANFVKDGSAVQVQAFAAPRSSGLWDDIRGQLMSSVKDQGGTAEEREGPFGTELAVRLPVQRPDGRTGYRPARFLGVDGPRWFLRAILSGKAMKDPQEAARLEEFVRGIVVVRGQEAMAPQELIPLTLPGQQSVDEALDGPGPLAPPERGPEITQIG